MAAPLSKYLRRISRASLSPASLLTLSEAAEALPCRSAEARGGIRLHCSPAAVIAGVELFSWSEIPEAMGVHATEQAARDDSTPGLHLLARALADRPEQPRGVVLVDAPAPGRGAGPVDDRVVRDPRRGDPEGDGQGGRAGHGAPPVRRRKRAAG